jgi:hypothetical protein
MIRFRRALMVAFVLLFAINGSVALAGSVTRYGVTVTTPDTYGACPATTTSDTITSSGITSTEQIMGSVSVQWVTDTGRIDVPGGYYEVHTDPGQNLNLTVSYPPITQWQSGEIHVDLSLTLYDKGDPVYVDGQQVKFGPGQPWDVYCLNFPGPPPPDTGCSLTIGFWKTHAGFTGHNPDEVTSLLPIWLGTSNGFDSLEVTTAKQAVDVLSMKTYGSASNGITKLYAQLLGAKLSIANGASETSVASTISDADAFLANTFWTGWSSLTSAQQQQVLAWMNTLDQFNNGLIGPGHCGS